MLGRLFRGALCAPFFFAATVSAQTEVDNLEPVPAPPPPPEQLRSGEVIEPDVTIIQRARETITEYRFNGRLYAIKVTPKNTPSYFLVDADGDGDLETRQKELSANFLIPNWVLLQW